jgi:hypothetical protein
MRWAGHIARTGKMRNMYVYIYIIFWFENLKGRNHSEDFDVDGRIILEWILGK